MRASQKNIVKMKKIDLDDAINNINGSYNQSNIEDFNCDQSILKYGSVHPNRISTTRVEWNVSISRPSFSIPDSNTALFYKQAYENLLKQNSPNLLEIKNDKVNVAVNALLSPRMNFRASKSLSTRESSITSTTEDEEGFVQINQYKVIRDLGRGAYGLVKLVEDQNENLFALKIISKRKLMKSSGYFRRPPPLRNTSTSSFCDYNRRETVSQTCSPAKYADSKLKRKTSQENNLWGFNSTNESSGKDPYLDPLRRIYQEIAIYKKLDNPHIVKLQEVIDEPDQDNLYMIFEHIEGGPVMNVGISEPLSEELSRKYFRDIICGLDYLHFNKIIHRDIKPSNLLVDKNGVVKLIDFGVSCQFTGDDIFLQDTLGSPAFLAPECVQDCHGKFMGKALDIWALGMTLHCLLFGKVAFDSRNKIDLYHSIATKPVVLPNNPELSPDVYDLLTKMLNKVPDKRITLNELKEHQWVTENGKWSFPVQKQQVEVSDKEIDQCTVKPVRIQTIVSALMMARRRSFRNPKKSFHPLTKFDDPRSQSSLNRNFDASNFSIDNNQTGDPNAQSQTAERHDIKQDKPDDKETIASCPSNECNIKPSTSRENIFNIRNIFTRFNLSSSESNSDNENQ